jgi:hypothetical protein
MYIYHIVSQFAITAVHNVLNMCNVVIHMTKNIWPRVYIYILDMTVLYFDIQIQHNTVLYLTLNFHPIGESTDLRTGQANMTDAHLLYISASGCVCNRRRTLNNSSVRLPLVEPCPLLRACLCVCPAIRFRISQKIGTVHIHPPRQRVCVLKTRSDVCVCLSMTDYLQSR